MTETGVRETSAMTDAAAMTPARDIRPPRRAGGPSRARRGLAQWAWGLAGLLAVVLVWEGY
jgi:hypothetical protein